MRWQYLFLSLNEKKEPSESANSRTDVESNLDGKSDDTATRQNPNVSIGKNMDDFSETQENDIRFHFIDEKGALIENLKYGQRKTLAYISASASHCGCHIQERA